MEEKEIRRPNHLAWHETLELHELVVFQSIGLMKLKKFIGDVKEILHYEDYTEKQLKDWKQTFGNY